MSAFTFISSLFILHVIFDYSLSAILQSRDLNTKMAADMVKQRIPGKCNASQYDCGEKCISIDKWRDCTEDCADKSDEDCWPGMIKCTGSCVCVDQADELTLCVNKYDTKVCNIAGSFKCKNGKCVVDLVFNDTRNDCGDWSDEPMYMSTVLAKINATTPSTITTSTIKPK